MDYQQILELVKEVSKAGLTNFEYTEGNIRIAMSCPQPEEKIVVPASLRYRKPLVSAQTA